MSSSRVSPSTRPVRRRVAMALGACALLASAATARADVLTIDSDSAGTLYDGVIDGFPGLATFDGTADLKGNALAVALLDGVTEERGIVEFPLDALVGLGSGDIVSATLSFNIDDVLSSFGPGTTFDGTAAESIVLFSYSGDGSIDLSDYENVAGAPLAVVSTAAFGTITDASLAVSGPLAFDVDITSALAALLDGAATHLGLVFATQDEGSATSLDNLGIGGGGPEGTGGAFLPLVTVVTVTDDPPVFGTSELKCQKAIAKAAAKHSKAVFANASKCMDLVLASVSKSGSASAAAAACEAAADPTDPASKVSKSAAKAEASIAKGCDGLDPSNVGAPCDEGAADIATMAACVVAAQQQAAERALGDAYAAGCDLLGAVGLDAAYPVLCAAD